tara:strand:- start:81 stop:383 length:303 start_codon:yes stop_codon:yes gene_type:complete
MQTLIDNTTKRSMYFWSDDEKIDVLTDRVTVGDPLTLTIFDHNSSTCTLIKDVANKTDWNPYRYIYDGGWKNNHPLDDGKTYIWKEEDVEKEIGAGWFEE